MTNQAIVEESEPVQSCTVLVKQRIDNIRASQERLIDALNDGVDNLLKESLQPGASVLPMGLSYGKPPFVVLDEKENALLLLDENLRYHKLEPLFVLEDAFRSDDFDVVHTMPSGTGSSLIHFVPVDPDCQFPVDESHFKDIDTQLLDQCDEAYDAFITTVQVISKRSIAKYLFHVQGEYKQIARGLADKFGEDGIDYHNALKILLLSKPAPLMEIYSTQISSASQQVIERMEADDDDDEEDTDHENEEGDDIEIRLDLGLE
jgi:hypothetical protein